MGRDLWGERANRSFAASCSSGMKLPHWREGTHWDKTIKGLQLYNGNFTYLSSPSASPALEHGSFVSVIHVNDYYRGLRLLQ